MVFYGLIDPEFGPQGLIDPEVNQSGLIDAELSATTTTSAVALSDDGEWSCAQFVRVAAAAVVLSLAVTTLGYADELPSAPVPDDDSYAVTLQKPVTPAVQIPTWGVNDDLPVTVVTIVEDDGWQPLVLARTAAQPPPLWTDDDFPRVAFEDEAAFVAPLRSVAVRSDVWSDTDDLPVSTVFEDDAFTPSSQRAAAAVRADVWFDADDLPVAPAEYDPWEPQRARVFIAAQPPAGDDDLVQQPATIVEEEYWYATRAQPRAIATLSVDHVDEVPVLVPTEGEWTPFVYQRIDHFVDGRIWTEPDEWPTPVPPAAVPTESEWTPLVADRLERAPDLRIWSYADEIPSANVLDESTWTLPVVVAATVRNQIVDATDELPNRVLDETSWLPFDVRTAKPVVQIFDAQDDLIVVGALAENDWTAPGSCLIRPITQVWETQDEHPTADHLVDADDTTLDFGCPTPRQSVANPSVVDDDLPSVGPLPPPYDAYQTLVISNAALIFSRMNDADGTARDSSGHNNDGAYIGSVTKHVQGALASPNDPYAAAISTDGETTVSGAIVSAAQVAVNLQPAIFGHSRLTQELWFKIDGSKRPLNPANFELLTALTWDDPSGLGGSPTIYVLWHPAGAHPGFWTLHASLLSVTPFVGGSEINTWNIPNDTALVPIYPDLYYYVAFTYDLVAQEQRLYVNGALVKTLPLTGGATFAFPELVSPGISRSLSIGYDPSTAPNAGFDGTLDEIAVYGSILSTADIAARWALRAPDHTDVIELGASVTSPIAIAAVSNAVITLPASVSTPIILPGSTA